MISTALARIQVGVVVQRHAAKSPWLDFLWTPLSVLAGVPSAAPWTPIGPATTFYAGEAVIELHRAETANYRDNLASGAPMLWIVLRATTVRTVIDIRAVTADPATGEALTGAGNDLIETVPMPQWFCERLEEFIAEHHVEQPTFRRRLDRAGVAAGRAGGGPEDEG